MSRKEYQQRHITTSPGCQEIRCQILNWEEGPPPDYLVCNALEGHLAGHQFIAMQRLGAWMQTDLRDVLLHMERKKPPKVKSEPVVDILRKCSLFLEIYNKSSPSEVVTGLISQIREQTKALRGEPVIELATPRDIVTQEWHRAVEKFNLRPGSPTEELVSRITLRLAGIDPDENIVPRN